MFIVEASGSDVDVDVAWIQAATPKERDIKNDELADMISELSYRVLLLVVVDPAVIEADLAVDCDTNKAFLSQVLVGIITLAKLGSSLPAVGTSLTS